MSSTGDHRSFPDAILSLIRIAADALSDGTVTLAEAVAIVTAIIELFRSGRERMKSDNMK